MAPYSVIKERNVANVSTDRILKVIALEGKTMSSEGQTRTTRTTFQGNKLLHAVLVAGLWHLEYRQEDGRPAGALPEPLKQQWTNFNQLRKFLDGYFLARNFKIEEVIA